MENQGRNRPQEPHTGGRDRREKNAESLAPGECGQLVRLRRPGSLEQGGLQRSGKSGLGWSGSEKWTQKEKERVQGIQLQRGHRNSPEGQT